jgi:ribosome biogenesis GTPase
MSKRRLSQQQRSRITRNQEQRQTKLDQPSDGGAKQSNERSNEELGSEQTGLVICHFGQQLEIESTASGSEGDIYRCFQRTNLPPLATGDRVIWQADGESSGVVVALQERISLMSRPNQQSVLRPIAANISVVAIVIAPLPEPFPNLVDRYLVMAESLNLKPLIVLNKMDIFEPDRDAAIEKMLGIYQGIGYPVIRVSSTQDSGIDELKAYLAQQTVVFVGQSGVGKSSLVNSLRGDLEDDAAVGAMSTARDKGTHTTTAARLYHLPGSGDLVDSPGIREFGLWHMDEQTIFDGYKEFGPFSGHCKFRDCSHRQEPGCAILQAVEGGKISPERLQSYFFLLSSID